MPHYVLLMKYHSDGMREWHSDKTKLNGLTQAIERWEAKVVSSHVLLGEWDQCTICLLYTSPSPRDQRGSRMPSSA